MKLICPKCGQDEIFYQKERFNGFCNFVVDNEGLATDYNSDLYDHAEHTLRSIYYYCCDCGAKVAKIPEDERF
ncbi:hypothetical protein [Eggerthia catenaformis]